MLCSWLRLAVVVMSGMIPSLSSKFHFQPSGVLETTQCGIRFDQQERVVAIQLLEHTRGCRGVEAPSGAHYPSVTFQAALARSGLTLAVGHEHATSTANNIDVLPYSEAGALALTATCAWLFGTALVWSCAWHQRYGMFGFLSTRSDLAAGKGHYSC
jgi:hypothetical protein